MLPPIRRLFRKRALLLVFILAFLLVFYTGYYIDPKNSKEGLNSFFEGYLGDYQLPWSYLPKPLRRIPVTQWVNVFIGTDGPGHVFPGATLPHGLVKVGIDTTELADGTAGYTKKGEVTGISHLHVSGTGGGNSYQVISVLPIGRHKIFEPNSHSFVSRRSHERASVGYFAVQLDDFNADVELSATRRGAIHRYTWLPEAPPNVHIIFDIGHMPSHMYHGGNVHISKAQNDTSKVRVTGKGIYRDVWSGAYGSSSDGYEVSFCAETDGEIVEWGVWDDQGQKKETDSIRANGGWPYIGGYLTLKLPDNSTTPHQTHVRVGISFVSIDKACENLETEVIPYTFDEIHAKAVEEWEEALQPLQVSEDTSDTTKTLLYSSLYRTMLMPVDRTNENPKWNSSEPSFDDFYCIWDTFRTVSPLLTLLRPKTQTRIVRSLIDIYRYDGWMPDSRVGMQNGLTQAGSNADVVLADAFVKGLGRKELEINWEDGWAAMVQNAEEEPPNFLYEGRGDLDAWKNPSIGYIPANPYASSNLRRSAARTMEYSYNDFCLAQVALGLNKTDAYRTYQGRSGNWQNLWNDNIISFGEKGFIQPRLGNRGEWLNEIWDDVTLCSPINFRGSVCYFDFCEFYESSSWAYSLYVPHDTASVVRLAGGPEAFVRRLDIFFRESLYDPGNEPSFLVPFMYNYAGRPDKTALRSREILKKNFNTTQRGLPGNDDSGAMGAWLVFATLGIFPVAGQDLYLIGSPQLSHATLYLESEDPTITFELVAHGVNSTNIYVQRARLNGVDLTRSWFRHTDIRDGGVLELWMADLPSDSWGRNVPPPSYNSGLLQEVKLD